MINHKLEVHQIPKKTPPKDLHHMDIQETTVLIIKKERGSHLAINYGPEVYKELLTHHRRGTNGSGEPHRDAF